MQNCENTLLYCLLVWAYEWLIHINHINEHISLGYPEDNPLKSHLVLF